MFRCLGHLKFTENFPRKCQKVIEKCQISYQKLPIRLRSFLPTYHDFLLRFFQTKNVFGQEHFQEKNCFNIGWSLKTFFLETFLSYFSHSRVLFICLFFLQNQTKKPHFSYLHTSSSSHWLRDLWFCIFTVSKKANFKRKKKPSAVRLRLSRKRTPSV